MCLISLQAWWDVVGWWWDLSGLSHHAQTLVSPALQPKWWDVVGTIQKRNKGKVSKSAFPFMAERPPLTTTFAASLVIAAFQGWWAVIRYPTPLPPIPAGQSTACESCKPVEKIQHGAGGVRFRAGATGGEQSEMPPVGAPTTPTGGGTGDGNRVLCSHAGHSIGGCDSFSAWPGAVGAVSSASPETRPQSC